jgi:hypothetical protein
MKGDGIGASGECEEEEESSEDEQSVRPMRKSASSTPKSVQLKVFSPQQGTPTRPSGLGSPDVITLGVRRPYAHCIAFVNVRQKC